MEDELVKGTGTCAPTRDTRTQTVKDNYSALFEVIARLLYRHDPIRLAAIGAPSDEYEPEVTAIIPRLHKASSPRELHEIVHTMFVQLFDRRTAGLKERYTAIAEDIWAAWQEHDCREQISWRGEQDE